MFLSIKNSVLSNDAVKTLIHRIWRFTVLAKSMLKRLFRGGSSTENSSNSNESLSALTANMNLTDKRVLVSGATGFLGSHIAQALYDAGAKVTLLGRNEEKLQDMVKSKFTSDDPLAKKAPVTTLCGSVNNQDDAQKIAQRYVEEHGALDLLVNCIGSAEDKPFVFHTANEIGESMASNLNPIVYLCEAFLPKFVERKSGNIINFSSITGLVGQPMRSLYGANKGAVIAYSKSIARRYAADNIRVNCIAPQVVTGGLAEKMSDDVRVLLQETTPIKRDCVAKDLEGAVLMLANEQQGFVSGSVVNVTGGLVTW